MISNIDLGKRLKHFRKNKGITQEEIAKYCHVSKNHISALERGIYTCSAPTLIGYAERLSITLDELAGPLEYHDIPVNDTVMGEPPHDKAQGQTEPNILPELQEVLCCMSRTQQQQILDIIGILKYPMDAEE